MLCEKSWHKFTNLICRIFFSHPHTLSLCSWAQSARFNESWITENINKWILNKLEMSIIMFEKSWHKFTNLFCRIFFSHPQTLSLWSWAQSARFNESGSQAKCRLQVVRWVIIYFGYDWKCKKVSFYRMMHSTHGGQEMHLCVSKQVCMSFEYQIASFTKYMNWLNSLIQQNHKEEISDYNANTTAILEHL